MNLKISQVKENNQYYVKLERSKEFKDFIWHELIKTIKQFQDTPFKEESSNKIVAEWVAFLSILHDLNDLREIRFSCSCHLHHDAHLIHGDLH